MALRASMGWARVMRGMSSMENAVILRAARALIAAALVGGWTLRRMSALLKTSSSRRAPFSSYSASKNPADSPAPVWTITSKRAFVSFGTSSATSATRCSPGTVSFGTLTIIGICESVETLLARYCNPVCPSGYFPCERCPPAVPIACGRSDLKIGQRRFVLVRDEPKPLDLVKRGRCEVIASKLNYAEPPFSDSATSVRNVPATREWQDSTLNAAPAVLDASKQTSTALPDQREVRRKAVREGTQGSGIGVLNSADLKLFRVRRTCRLQRQS